MRHTPDSASVSTNRLSSTGDARDATECKLTHRFCSGQALNGDSFQYRCDSDKFELLKDILVKVFQVSWPEVSPTLSKCSRRCQIVSETGNSTQTQFTAVSTTAGVADVSAFIDLQLITACAEPRCRDLQHLPCGISCAFFFLKIFTADVLADLC